MFVGAIVVSLSLLRYVSNMLVLSINFHSEKEVPMVRTFIARARVFISSMIETIWSIAAGITGGHLST